MKLFGVINASPDSLHAPSIATNPAQAATSTEWSLDNGVFCFDLGGQGSTFSAFENSVEEEWARLAAVLPTLLSYEGPTSVETWRPETARRSLNARVSWLNAADGLQQDHMMVLAAEYACPVVLPFLSAPDPLRMERVTEHDPVRIVLNFFDRILARADDFGIRRQIVIDPGAVFAPDDWPWDERFVRQKQVYSRLDRLRVYELPLYIALPWNVAD